MQDREETRAGGQGPLGSAWASYLMIGAVLAVARVALFFWVSFIPPHELRVTMGHYLLWALYPEGLLGERNVLGVADLVWRGGWVYRGFWSSILTVGSFVYAIPIVLLARFVRRRC